MHPNSKYYQQAYLLYKETITYGTNIAYVTANVEHYVPDLAGSSPYQTFKRIFSVRFNLNGHATSVVTDRGITLIGFENGSH